VRRLAAILLLLGFGTLLPAASTDYYLGESVRQLGLRDAPRQASDGRTSERYVSRGGVSLYAEYSKEFILVDGVKVMLEDPVGSQRGHLTLSKLDYEKVFVPLFWDAPKANVRRIVIDPGHGGKDTGKVNGPYKYNEKAATLDTAARLKILLEKQGFEVVFTRTKDVFVDLDDRPAVATNVKADLFISLHYNAGPAGDTSSDGIETYCLTLAGQKSTNAGKAKSTTGAEPGNRFDGANMSLAWGIQRRLLAGTGADDRGVRRARFAVLRTLSCPGVLIEGGFMSSRKEGAQIADAAYRQKIAEAVAAGIVDYVLRGRPAAKAAKAAK
jgi:N-acetylmuramoyl-L-alanine amidase